jgi:TPR repeat protein
MKMKWRIAGLLLLVLCTGVQLYAQQTDAARQLFENDKVKAEKGDVKSQLAIAEFYSYGIGMTQNAVEAVKWFRKAADQGNAEAEDGLGVCYRDGDGIPKDAVEAVKWFRKSAEQGLAEAQVNLGVCYHDGEGVARDYTEAINWYLKAANQGSAQAQYNLGTCYDDGGGIATNHVEAFRWYSRAANQGYADAQSNLGALYGKGAGVSKDYVNAYKWRLLAAAQGEDLAKKAVTALENVMTPEQIAEGQQLAREFIPRKETPVSTSANSASPANPTFTGTGFFITDDGYLISNYHVVKDATKVRLVTGAGTITAKVVRVDAANDLALLKAEGKFSPLPIAASRTAHLGGTVATVGFPNIGLQGFSPKLAKGEIASLSGAADDARYFQISVPVQPGNSGGALVDEHGNVIGIVSAKLDASAALAASGSLPENVNYAVKSSFLLSFLESVPAVSAKLKEPITADRKFEDVVKSAQDAAVLVLVY